MKYHKILNERTPRGGVATTCIHIFSDGKVVMVDEGYANDETVNGGAGNLALCESWTTHNATTFGSSLFTIAEFDAMTDDSQLLSIANLTNSKATDLAVDNIIAFETVDGKKGLIKVSDLISATDGTITIDVLMQE